MQIHIIMVNDAMPLLKSEQPQTSLVITSLVGRLAVREVQYGLIWFLTDVQ